MYRGDKLPEEVVKLLSFLSILYQFTFTPVRYIIPLKYLIFMEPNVESRFNPLDFDALTDLYSC